MSEILNNINELYKKHGYLDRYGSSIFITVMIFLIYFYIYIYFFALGNLKDIKQDWNNQRCNPKYIPLAGLINKPPGESTFSFTAKNFSYCTGNILKSMMDNVFLPFIYLFKILNQSVNLLIEIINSTRKIMTNIREALKLFFIYIYEKFMQILTPVFVILISFKDLLKKMNGVLVASMYTSLGVYLSMITGIRATWELMIIILVGITAAMYTLFAIPFTAPMAVLGLVVYVPMVIILTTFLVLMTNILKINGVSPLPKIPGKKKCFSRDTIINTTRGKIPIYKLEVGDILDNSSKITSLFKLDSTGVDMYNLNNIIVSGNHKVLYKSKFINVCNHPNANKVKTFDHKYIYCFNIDKKYFKLNNNTFTDWDELDLNDFNVLKLKYAEYLDNNREHLKDTYDIHKKLESGFHEDTIIDLVSSKKPIKDIEVNDILKNGVKVEGIVVIDASDLDLFKYYLDDNIIIGTSNLCYQKDGKIFNTLKYHSKEIIKKKENLLYHILTDKNYFYINNIKFYDYNCSIEQFFDDESIFYN